MKRSMKKFVFFKDLFIHFVLTHEYVSNLLLSSDMVQDHVNEILSET